MTPAGLPARRVADRVASADSFDSTLPLQGLDWRAWGCIFARALFVLRVVEKARRGDRRETVVNTAAGFSCLLSIVTRVCLFIVAF